MPAFAKNDPDRAGDNPAPYWYMGAGNPKDGHVPSNKADEIAMDHDYEYGSATSFADVRRADDKFVERMRHQPGIWPDRGVRDTYQGQPGGRARANDG